MKEKSKLFLVLCLHRSGSSATAGIMQLLGIHMGDKLIPATIHNPKGHYENADYVSLNQEILRTVNSSWNKPPSREKIEGANFPIAKIRAFLAKHVKPIWGLKDPRTLLTFEIWKPYLEEVADITYVFVHRPFEASVRSLAHRDRYGIGIANQILTPYLKNLYHYRHTYGILPENIIDVYYPDLLNDPKPIVMMFNEKIGNPPDHQLNKVNEFLDNKLKNF
ncbi:sulfotransferase family protein [Peribacillus tepidiphilus]|uniref:sulfotransferase family protein n=1 Tax=Peribacillus tepidiphilus TaxID=2652445 RepID=UPI0035B54A7F